MKKYILSLILIIQIITLRADDWALLVGIGEYPQGAGWSVIHGDNDIDLLLPDFEKNGFHVTTLKNKEATKSNILRSLNNIIDKCKNGDRVYIHFSTHGQLIEDINGDDEIGRDQSIVPYDAEKIYRKNIYMGENHLIDDELNMLLDVLTNKIGKAGFIFVAVDACHSKGISRDEYEDEEEDLGTVMRGADRTFIFGEIIPNSIKNITYPKQLSGGATIIVISACLEEEVNYEYKNQYGSLSYCISLLLKKDTDFIGWSDFFQQKRYKELKIFKSIQHPNILIYR